MDGTDPGGRCSVRGRRDDALLPSFFLFLFFLRLGIHRDRKAVVFFAVGQHGSLDPPPLRSTIPGVSAVQGDREGRGKKKTGAINFH